MRHGKKFNHLGRKAAHRKALLKNLSLALIEHKRITTTVAKAKALRKHIEPILTRAKSDSTHNRRMAFKYLQNKYAIQELFGPISDKIADRPGGYTRVLRTGFRKGDNAEMAMIELVDYNENMFKETKKKKSRRRRGGGKSADTAAKTGAAASATDVVENVVEDVKETATEAKEAVVEKAADVKEAVADKVADAKKAVTEKVADAKEAVADKAAEAKEVVAEKVKDVKDAVADKTEEIADKAEDIVEDATDGDADTEKA